MKKRMSVNQKGSALMLVVCIMALLSIVGSALLVKTTSNSENKANERKAQSGFSSTEVGSNDFVSALEAVCQDSVKLAFTDLLIDYTKLSDVAAQSQRFTDVFQASLMKTLNQDEAAAKMMKKALGLADDATLDVAVSFDKSKIVQDAAADATKTGTITLKGVKFSYKDAQGNSSSIVTDIKIKADVPNVGRGMVAGTCAEFYDFALISGGNVYTPASTNLNKKINGNVFVEKNLTVNHSSSKMYFSNADKLLVKGTLDIDGAEVEFNNSTELIATGKGLWAGNIRVANGGKANGINTNVYVKDDLTMSGNGPQFVFGGSENSVGGEYIGYSGDPQSAKSSAITINSAKDIKLDMSKMSTLVLRGNSYIQDKLWEKASTNAENLLGILQGESLAYKDMQAMYLVPSEATPFGQNPILKDNFTELTEEQLKAIKNFDISDEYDVSHHFPLSNYVSETEPVVKRYVILDGGSTEFVYLYLNFKSEGAAKQFYNDYLSTSRGAAILEQIKNLNKTGISMVKLPSETYTLANVFEYYDGKDFTTKVPNLANSSLMNSKARTAAKNYTGLFSFFRLDYTTIIPDDYNVINEAVLRDSISNVLAENGKTAKMSVDFEGYKFLAVSGDVKTGDLTDESGVSMNGKKGIILVEGNLTNNVSFTFEGLVLCTGDYSMNEMSLKANKDIVLKMLDEPLIAQFFRGQGAAAANNKGAYVSTDSVDISFENWQKNG